MDRWDACEEFSKANPWAQYSEYGHVVISDKNIETYFVLNALTNLADQMSVMIETPAGVQPEYYDLLYFYVDLLKLPLPKGWDDEA